MNYKSFLKRELLVSGFLLSSVYAETSLKKSFKNTQSIEHKVCDQNSDEILLARLIYGEARGESRRIKQAVADTVINRKNKKRYGNTVREVILKPHQYSCFNKNDQNKIKIENPLEYESSEIWNECFQVANETLSKKNKDDANGATHYYDTSIKKPKWAKGKIPVLVLKTKRNREIKFYKADE